MHALLRSAADRLLASDPALARLRTGVWALLTAGLATAALLAIAHLFGLEPEPALLGVVVGLMSIVTVQDPDPARQQGTLAWTALLASAVIVLGAAAVDDFGWSAAGFIAVVVAAYEARRFGPRGVGLGTMAMQAWFYAMLLHPELHDAAWIVLFVCAGCAVAWLVRFHVWPERPRAILAGELHALRARIVVLLHDLARSLVATGERPAKRARAGLAALAALGLRIEQRVASHQDQPDAPAGDGLRDRLLQCEIAAETLASCTDAARSADAPGRQRLAALLQGLAEQVRIVDARSHASFDAARVTGLPLPEDLRWRLAHAAGALLARPPWAVHVPAPVLAAEADIAQAQHAPRQQGRPAWLRDEPTRRALQAGVAALGAVVAGHALSAQHWYWAVFGSSIVFTRALSRGQALAQGWSGTVGNVAGLAFGLLLAELAHGRTPLQLALLFTFIGVGFYAYRAFQPVYTALLTAMLAMLYELMGMYSPGLLVLRLEESLAGAVIAVLVGAWVLPVGTSDHADHESAGVLREAARVLRGAFAGHPQEASAAVRDLDRRLQASRQALGPMTRSGYPGPKAQRRERLQQLGKLVYCVRHLYQLLADRPELARDEPLRERAASAADTMEHVATALDATQDAEQAPPVSAPAPEPEPAGRGDPAHRIAAGWLRQVGELARRLAA